MRGTRGSQRFTMPWVVIASAPEGLQGNLKVGGGPFETLGFSREGDPKFAAASFARRAYAALLIMLADESGVASSHPTPAGVSRPRLGKQPAKPGQ